MTSDLKLDVELGDLSEHKIHADKRPSIECNNNIRRNTPASATKPFKKGRVQKALDAKLKVESLGNMSKYKIPIVILSSTVCQDDIGHKTLALTTTPGKRRRVQKVKIIKEKKPKVTVQRKAKKTTKSGSRKIRAQKNPSPTLSQYSSESDYENPERENLSYFS